MMEWKRRYTPRISDCDDQLPRVLYQRTDRAVWKAPRLPSRVYPDEYWSPALVAFVGFGHGFGFGFGFGNVGWCPIAPFEPFHRWWGGGYYGGFGGLNRTTINNTTIVNNINITNIYRNANVTNGVTAVNAAQFGQNCRNFRHPEERRDSILGMFF